MIILLAVSFLIFLICGIIALIAGKKHVGWSLLGVALLVLLATLAFLFLFMTSNM